MTRLAQLALPMLVLFLAGCAGTAKAPGSTEVLFSTPDTIKVQWDEILSGEKYARQMALEHCKGRQIEEIDASSNAAVFGLSRSKTWRCVGPKK